jgi:CheY-like chemotaxis protein
MAKIMLVEDDNNLREIYEARLLAEGYQIVSAKDGEEALAMAVKEKPDLIIADVMMPKISGFDMLDILRSTPETRDTKVVMMTALSQAEDKARADKLGADRYLVKSQVTLEDVAKVAHEVLAGEGSGETGSTTPVNQDPAQTADPPTSTDTTSQPTVPLATSSTDMPVTPAPADPVAPVADDLVSSTPVTPVSNDVADNPPKDIPPTTEPIAEQGENNDTNDPPADTSQASEGTEPPLIKPEVNPAPSQAANASSEASAEKQINDFLATPATAITPSQPSAEPATDTTAASSPSEENGQPERHYINVVDGEDKEKGDSAPIPKEGPSPDDLADAVNAIMQPETPPVTTPVPVTPDIIPPTQEQTGSPAPAAPPESVPELPTTKDKAPNETSDESSSGDNVPVAHKKVIQPINDLTSKGPDLNELLAEEADNPSPIAPPANTVIAPGGTAVTPAAVLPSTPPPAPEVTQPGNVIQPVGGAAPSGDIDPNAIAL